MIFGRLPLSGKALGGVVVFTLIETVILTVWLEVAGVHITRYVGAVAILLVGLFVEHYIATQIGQQDK